MNYWVKRALQIEDREYTRSNKLILDLEKEFARARAGIERDINYYLERICIDNKLSYTEAKRKLKKGELEVFRLSLDDYIKKGQGVLTEVTIQELKNASNLYNISRLQAMGLEMKKHVDYLYAKYLDKTKNFLATTYEQSFYQSMYDLQMVTGVKHLTKLDNQMLEKIIKRPWLPDNKNFSDRIWENQNKLVNELQKVLMQKAIMQTDMQECIETLAKRMDVSFSNAKRLVQTENAYFTTQALTDSYKKGSCKMYENVATLDNKTSEICQSMDGTKFKFSDMEIGINAPPFHCNCRTVIVPAYNDEIERELDEEAGRMARNPITGKTEHISNMKYDEWYKRYVISNEKAKVIEKQYKNRHSDRKQYDNYVSVLGRETVGNIGKFKDLKYNDSDKWERLKRDYSVINAINNNEDILSKNRAKELYYKFKDENIYASDHFIEQFIKREFDKKGNVKLTFDKVVDLSKKEFNYIDTRNGREIKYYDGISLIIEKGKYITIRKGRLSKKWKMI